MLLVIDIGNSNIVLGLCRQRKIVDTFRLVSDKTRTADETGLCICQYLDFAGVRRQEIKAVVIASVVPDLTETLKHAVQEYLSLEPLIVGEDLPVGITNLYENPEQTGIDRLVNAAAAVEKYGAPLIVIDMGTATTVDAMDETGAFMGGVIFPGIGVLADCLSEKTAQLPKTTVTVPEKVIGRNTAQCMQAGIYYGYVGALERIVTEMKSEMSGDSKVVATGGLIKVLVGSNLKIDYLDETLILDGLRRLYEKKEKQND